MIRDLEKKLHFGNFYREFYTLQAHSRQANLFQKFGLNN